MEGVAEKLLRATGWAEAQQACGLCAGKREGLEMASRKQVGLGWEEKGPVVGAPGPSG
jgi:hypothetical protein